METCLVPIFELDVRRTVWSLSLPNQTKVQLSMDTGGLHRGYIHEPICEAELGLQAGDPHDTVRPGPAVAGTCATARGKPQQG